MQRSTPVGRFPILTASCAAILLAAASSARAQVFVVEPEHVEKHYTQFNPTEVKLSTEPLTTLSREQLIRFLQSEQGFAMRPLPVGTLTLVANGHMEPGGEKYIDELHAKGIAAKAGDRVVVTDIKIKEDRIVLDLNNGPEHKHKYLRHVSIGMGAAETPLAADNGAPPTGSRLVLSFPKRVPDLNGEQVEQLLKPMIDFGVKSPAEAYAETLPDFLAKAIKEHRVLVGMDRDMVRYAKGQPIQKIREDEDGKPIEIWLYGQSPDPVEFVRFSGSFVIRVEEGRVGEPLLVRSANEMGDYWGNQPVVASNQHEIKMGDTTAADANQENAPRKPPTLRNPGEKLPADDPKSGLSTMAPVNMPKDQQRPGDPGYTPTVSAHPDAPASQGGQNPGQGSSGQTSGQGSGQTSGQGSGQGQGSGSSQPNPLDSASSPTQQH